MTDDARMPSSLKGRLADVYVPALVAGKLDALSRRLGNRATIDDPLFGRASTLASLDPLIAKVAGWFAERNATYRHVYSTTGVDRDACEGMVTVTENGQTRELPIVVVAERRRLREIELRIYHAGDGKTRRPPMIGSRDAAALPTIVQTALDAMKSGAIESALATFEESGRVVDAHGLAHRRSDGSLGTWLGEADLEASTSGVADDGRCCCVEAALVRPSGHDAPAVLAFERGESGLVRELRIYVG